MYEGVTFMNTTHQTPQELIAALSALNDDALKLLTGLEIRSLTESQLKALTPKQIATFSIAQLISLNVDSTTWMTR